EFEHGSRLQPPENLKKVTNKSSGQSKEQEEPYDVRASCDENGRSDSQNIGCGENYFPLSCYDTYAVTTGRNTVAYHRKELGHQK
ncbi:MAG: hypothetical protein WBC50_09050, partial [Dehalococcoidales bacterium]